MLTGVFAMDFIIAVLRLVNYGRTLNEEVHPVKLFESATVLVLVLYGGIAMFTFVIAQLVKEKLFRRNVFIWFSVNAIYLPAYDFQPYLKRCMTENTEMFLGILTTIKILVMAFILVSSMRALTKDYRDRKAFQ